MVQQIHADYCRCGSTFGHYQSIYLLLLFQHKNQSLSHSKEYSQYQESKQHHGQFVLGYQDELLVNLIQMKKIRKQSKFLMEIQLLVLYFGGIYNRYGFEIFSIKYLEKRSSLIGIIGNSNYLYIDLLWFRFEIYNKIKY